MHLIEELKWRGLVQDITPETEDKLAKDKVVGYIGFDPTADSLHIGSLIPILLLKHLQRFGHTPIALVGGATGMVGDPSGKTSERTLLQEEQLQHNLTCIAKQLAQFLDFSTHIPNPAKVVNNYDWFKTFNVLHFLRDIGKHITISYMLSKDSVQTRLQSEQGISFTEFSYQLVQGYDFLWLFQHLNCEMQMGGSDQWGNITTGIELIRRKTGKTAYALTCPLMTKTDGSKFGKSATGNIWLDPHKTSPFHFFQFWINTADEDAKDWIKKFTFLTQDEINSLTERALAQPSARILQYALAEHITTLVHGAEAYHKAKQTSEALFQEDSLEVLLQLSKDEFEDVFKGVDVHELPADKLLHINIVDLLTLTKITVSKSEARNCIAAKSISINRQKITALDFLVQQEHIIHRQYILINKGKKKNHLVKLI